MYANLFSIDIEETSISMLFSHEWVKGQRRYKKNISIIQAII